MGIYRWEFPFFLYNDNLKKYHFKYYFVCFLMIIASIRYSFCTVNLQKKKEKRRHELQN